MQVEVSEVGASPAPSVNEGDTPAKGRKRPVCQIKGCDTILRKPYDKKTKACANHRRSLQIFIGGDTMRFCQKCNVFEGLAEFDGGKRTCRARLLEHNHWQRRLRALHLQRLSADPVAADARSHAAAASAGETAGGAEATGLSPAQTDRQLTTAPACAAAEALPEMAASFGVMAQIDGGQGQRAEAPGSEIISARQTLPDGPLATRVGSTALGELLALGDVDLPWMDSGVPGFPDDAVAAPSAVLPAPWDSTAPVWRIVPSDSNNTHLSCE